MLTACSLHRSFRYNNPAHVELFNAAQEQQKITEKRLRDMFGDVSGGIAGRGPVPPPGSSASATRLAQVVRHISSKGVGGITSHVLDTCHGRPASGVTIRLEHAHPDDHGRPHHRDYSLVASAITNEQGRVTLLDNGQPIAPGRYKVWFDLAGYYDRCRQDSPQFFAAPAPFFPEASVVFEVDEEQAARWDHFHVPLTWSPFGYSTYRGS